MKKQIIPQQGSQYLVSVPGEIHGQFIVSIEKLNGEIIYTGKVLIQ